MTHRQDDTDHDDHDLGFAHDLPRMFGRCRVLTVMGGLGQASTSVLTAQIAIPKAELATVYTRGSKAYSISAQNLRRISIASDNVFGGNSAAEIAQQTLAKSGSVAAGFTGTVTIPIDFEADRR